MLPVARAVPAGLEEDGERGNEVEEVMWGGEVAEAAGREEEEELEQVGTAGGRLCDAAGTEVTNASEVLGTVDPVLVPVGEEGEQALLLLRFAGCLSLECIRFFIDCRSFISFDLPSLQCVGMSIYEYMKILEENKKNIYI